MTSTLKNQIQAALLRSDLKPEQKTALTDAQATLEKFGTNFRKVMEVRRSVMPIIGGGGGMMFGGGGGGMGFGRGMGGQAAEPGTYAVKLTVGGKTYTGKVSVRLDPIQEAAGN